MHALVIITTFVIFNCDTSQIFSVSYDASPSENHPSAGLIIKVLVAYQLLALGSPSSILQDSVMHLGGI